MCSAQNAQEGKRGGFSQLRRKGQGRLGVGHMEGRCCPLLNRQEISEGKRLADVSGNATGEKGIVGLHIQRESPKKIPLQGECRRFVAGEGYRVRGVRKKLLRSGTSGVEKKGSWRRQCGRGEYLIFGWYPLQRSGGLKIDRTRAVGRSRGISVLH